MKLTENQLVNLIKEALTELNWQTYKNASDKAFVKSLEAKDDKEKARRDRQHKSLKDKSKEELNKKHGVDKINKKHKENPHYLPNPDEMKQLKNQLDDFHSFNSGKQKYKHGKWLQENQENNSWRGCPNIQMIWHGNWNDPELIADGYVANYWTIENSMWHDFLEETGYKDSDSDNPEVEAKFNQYVQDHEDDVRYLISEWGKPINGEDDELNENKKNMKLTESKLRKMVAKCIKEALENKTIFSINFYDNNGIVDRSFDPDGNLFDTYEKAEAYAQKHAAELTKKTGNKINYEIKREPKWEPFANSIVYNDKVDFIKNTVKKLGNVKLSKACGKYYAMVDNGEETLALSFKGENGYDQTPIDNLSPQVIQAIYNDLYQNFGEK